MTEIFLFLTHQHKYSIYYIFGHYPQTTLVHELSRSWATYIKIRFSVSSPPNLRVIPSVLQGLWRKGGNWPPLLLKIEETWSIVDKFWSKSSFCPLSPLPFLGLALLFSVAFYGLSLWLMFYEARKLNIYIVKQQHHNLAQQRSFLCNFFSTLDLSIEVFLDSSIKENRYQDGRNMGEKIQKTDLLLRQE